VPNRLGVLCSCASLASASWASLYQIPLGPPNHFRATSSAYPWNEADLRLSFTVGPFPSSPVREWCRGPAPTHLERLTGLREFGRRRPPGVVLICVDTTS